METSNMLEKIHSNSETLTKSSMEILSELFKSFDAEPPIIVKTEKTEDCSMVRRKKSKKKHRHKDKKHHKKSKKHRSPSRSSSCKKYDINLVSKTKEVLEYNNICKVKEETDVDKNKSSNVISIYNETGNKVQDQKSLLDATIFAIKEETLKNISKRKDISVGDEDVESVRQCTKKRKHSKSDTSKDKRKKHHHIHRSHNRSKSSSRSRSSHRHRSRDKYDNFYDYKSESKYVSKSNDYSKYKDSLYKRDEKHSHRSKEVNDEDRKLKCWDGYKDGEAEKEKWFMRDRYRGYGSRDRKTEYKEKPVEASHIDKKKLLEIARKNAIQMMKSGSLSGALSLGPQAQEKVIAAIKCGGKTVEELTDFCKTLSKKEEMGELSSLSEENSSDDDSEKPFHHPFQIKEKPVSITMNIKNSNPLPIKNMQERTSELRIQFPVSSGQHHRKTENEWIPVITKNNETVTKEKEVAVTQPSTLSTIPLPNEEEPPPLSVIKPANVNEIPALENTPQVFPDVTAEQRNIDIAAIVSQRLSAMRQLQENPNNVQAMNIIYKAQQEMNIWAESKQQIGQFTGTTGAHIMTPAELSSGYQAWARKDQLQTAAPVSGGMGMHLLQKMGWKPGEGLGKEKSGNLEPLLLEVKLDKKGIVAKEEQQNKLKIQKPLAQTITGKHPVSLLGEYASKNKIGAPLYELCFECGPNHKKHFLFKVTLNGVEYKPDITRPNKKEAKANAALLCLTQLGVVQ